MTKERRCSTCRIATRPYKSDSTGSVPIERCFHQVISLKTCKLRREREEEVNKIENWNKMCLHQVLKLKVCKFRRERGRKQRQKWNKNRTTTLISKSSSMKETTQEIETKVYVYSMKYSTDPNSAVNECSTIPSSLISQFEPTISLYTVWLRSGKPTAHSALWVIQRLPSALHRFCSKSVPTFWRLTLSRLFKDTNTLQWQLQCTCCLNQMINKHRKYLHKSNMWPASCF